MKSQNLQILSYLKKGKKITAIEALKKFGSFRLAARIGELKEMGYKIKPETVEKNGKRFAEYRLVK